MQRRHWLLLATIASMSTTILAACESDDSTSPPLDAGASDAPADHTADHSDSASAQDANVADASAADAADAAVTDTSTPDTSAPDGNVPEASVPDTSVPDASVPDTSVPDTSVPDTSVPDTSVPDTSVPDTSVPDTSVPDTSVPDAADASVADAADAGNMHVFDWSFAIASGAGQMVTVKVGDFVSWHNTDGATHTVTSVQGSAFAFDTGNIAGGATSTPIQFTTAGTFVYYCKIHGITSMKGAITVQ
jgi:plastocyanin